MTKCTNCARSSELFLCPRCITELRDTLRDLPGWVTALQEDAWGQTRHGESVRRSTDKGSPALCKLGKDGSFKRSPGQWLVYTHSVAVEWTRDVCETRGIEVPELDTRGLLRWLARNVAALASDQGAAVAYREFKQIRETIERIVDRPRSPLFVGRCPTWMGTAGLDIVAQQCPADLVISPEAKHVRCRECKETYSVADLVEWRLDEAPPDLLFTASEVLDIMDIIRKPVPESTWRRWRATGQVEAVGELYGEPAYRIQDVREFRKKWTRAKAG
jgi:hypothetical protein